MHLVRVDLGAVARLIMSYRCDTDGWMQRPSQKPWQTRPPGAVPCSSADSLRKVAAARSACALAAPHSSAAGSTIQPLLQLPGCGHTHSADCKLRRS